MSVPRNWRSVTLGDVCEFKYGKSLPESARAGGQVPVFGSNGEVGRHNEALTAGPTIIIGRKGSFGEVNYSAVACWPIDTTYYVDATATDADLRWLTYRLSALGLNRLNRAAAVPGLNREDAYRQRLLLPPLPEQRRIAEILDKADALRAKRRAALKKLDELTQSIFLDMFGDPATNPKGWQWNRLGDVSDFFAGSTLPEGKTFTGQRKGYFLLKVSDMNLPGNDVYLKTCQQWSEVPGAASCTCPENSVVIPKRGGAIGTNKKRITTRPSVLDPNLMAIAPRPGQIELQFLYAWLLHLDLTSITSGSSVPQLNKRDLDPLSIAVPPFDLQQEFARHVAEVQKIVDSQKAAESHLEHLFSALQHRAFRGEL